VVFLTLQPLLGWFSSFGVGVPQPGGGINCQWLASLEADMTNFINNFVLRKAGHHPLSYYLLTFGPNLVFLKSDHLPPRAAASTLTCNFAPDPWLASFQNQTQDHADATTKVWLRFNFSSHISSSYSFNYRASSEQLFSMTYHIYR